MKKIGITKSNLYIKDFLLATRSNMTFKGISAVKCRHSDALIYVTGGSCSYEFDDGDSFSVKAGDILYLAKDSAYKMTLLSDLYSVIYFDFLFASEEKRKSAVYSPNEACGAENLFKKLLRTYRSSQNDYFAECMSLSYKIYGIVISNENGAYLDKCTKDKMLDVKNYIDRNYSDKTLGVASLARTCKTSEVYFRRLFKSAVGISPARYISRTRVMRAAELLLAGVSGLWECAELCGFSSVQYLCRVFTAEYGISPAKYALKKRERNPD